MKKILLLVFIVSNSTIYSQSNRVLNYSFEDYIDTFSLGIRGAAAFRNKLVTDWSDPNYSSSDLYTKNSRDNESTYPILDGVGYQYPHTGKVFAGFNIFLLPGSFREFVQASFMDSLVRNKTYAIKYYVSLNEYSQCFTDLGFYFSKNKIDTLFIFYFTKPYIIPQYENPSTNWINTFEGWQEMKGIYRAMGGEKYASIGNFTKDSMTNYQTCIGTIPSTDIGAYIYLDDVTIYDTSVIDTIRLCINDSIEINHQWYKPSTSIINEPFDSGVVVRHYIEALPNSTSYTEIDVPYQIGDTVQAGFLWVCHSSVSQTPTFVCDSFDLSTGCHYIYLWSTPDTFVDAFFQNIYGCDSTVRYHVRTNVGIGEPNTTTYNDITIYPNPAEQFINIEVSSIKYQELRDMKIEIYDAVGRTIKYDLINTKTTKDSSEFKINISNFSSGMYFVKVYDKNNRNIANGKFICR